MGYSYPCPYDFVCRLALSVQLLLRIDRPDLAEAQLKSMATIDDEAALTQLSTGFVYLALVRKILNCPSALKPAAAPILHLRIS